MNVLDLFSGIGGFSLGLERAGFDTVAFCEIDPFCRKVLHKHWPSVPCFSDVRTLDRAKLEANGVTAVDVICGGYPCQPFSSAGKRRGEADDRHLWPEMFRLIQELRPDWVIGENVAGHITMGLDEVLFDLESANYTARAFVIPACAVNAPHRRERVWVVANSNSKREQQPQGAYQEERGRFSYGGTHVADTKSDISRRLPERATQTQPGSRNSGEDGARARNPRHWHFEPRVGRMADGVSNRLVRNQALGNGLVAEIPEVIGRAIIGGLVL